MQANRLKNKLKAQMSLEMIIGMLILLVVAAVVIQMFLNVTKSIDPKEFKGTTDFKKFQSGCESYCRDFSTTGNLAYAALFCTQRLWPPGTMNKIGEPAKIDVLELQEGVPLIEGWPVCEDGIFCFHFFDCGGSIKGEDCREILCEYYGQMYEDPAAASQAVVEKMRDNARNPYGGCTLRGDAVWWKKYFGDMPCGR